MQQTRVGAKLTLGDITGGDKTRQSAGPLLIREGVLFFLLFGQLLRGSGVQVADSETGREGALKNPLRIESPVAKTGRL